MHLEYYMVSVFLVYLYSLFLSLVSPPGPKSRAIAFTRSVSFIGLGFDHCCPTRTPATPNVRRVRTITHTNTFNLLVSLFSTQVVRCGHS